MHIENKSIRSIIKSTIGEVTPNENKFASPLMVFIFSDECGDSLYITKEVKLPIDRNNNERRINSIVLNEFRSLK